MTSFTRSADGARIAFDITGAGRPILLIHGFSSNRMSWNQTGWTSVLADAGYQVLTFDVRGHGESDRPLEPSAYGAHLVEDMCTILDAAEVPVADVFGYSMGSQLAIALLLEHPERVGRVVIGGVGDAYFTRDTAWCLRTAEALEARDTAGISDRIALLHRKVGMENGNDPLALAAFMRSPPVNYSARDLKRSQRPVLVACGEHDEVSGRAEGLAAAFADGRALTLAGRDHMTAPGDPALKSAVLGFLAKPSSARG
jgi:pimeloyl-ACP methyl ester carboxylesterase